MKFSYAGTLCLAAAIFTGGTFTRAGAATIGSVSSFVTPDDDFGTIGPLGTTPAPNNDDDLGNSPNVIPYSFFFNAQGGIDTEFVLAQSGGTTEYFFPQKFVNNTDSVWTGFRFELGFGTGDDFVLSKLGDTLQFDSWENNSTARSPAFQLKVDQMKTLEWGDGKVGQFGTALFSFAIDVPDDLADANPSGRNCFTLRQTPIGTAVESDATAPEPATYALVGIVLAGIGLRRYARR